MIVSDLPKSLQPIVSVIDDWFTARRLALIFEGRVGKGRVLVCSIDLLAEGAQNPVCRQMLASLIKYVDSKAFNPDQELTLDQLGSLLKKQAKK